MVPRVGLLLIVVLLSTPVVTRANLLDGKDLRINALFPDVSTVFAQTDVVVGPGIEIDVSGFGFTIDVSDNNILYEFVRGNSFASTSFDGHQFFDFTSTVDSFTSVAIDPATNLPGFDASRIGLDSDNIFVNLQGLSFATGQRVSLNINVPEPTTFLLLGLGLAGLGFARKRQH